MNQKNNYDLFDLTFALERLNILGWHSKNERIEREDWMRQTVALLKQMFPEFTHSQRRRIVDAMTLRTVASLAYRVKPLTSNEVILLFHLIGHVLVLIDWNGQGTLENVDYLKNSEHASVRSGILNTLLNVSRIGGTALSEAISMVHQAEAQVANAALLTARSWIANQNDVVAIETPVLKLTHHVDGSVRLHARKTIEFLQCILDEDL